MDEATSRRPATVGVRELKNQLSAVLERVRQGEEITVTDHGRPVARLTAVDADTERLAALVRDGIVRPARAPRSLPRRRVKLAGAGPHLGEMVAAQRQ